ncbi:MAG: hypothetical protein HFF36_11255 [Coprobacillus sp.]|nr:hypothetical protein [Coprobacillus sp.]
MIKNFNYDEFMNSMGLNKLTDREKESIKVMFQYRELDRYIKEYPQYSKVISGGNDLTSNYYILFSNIYILKYLLESNSKSDQIIKQNNQIIELLQKIADK